MLLLVLVVIAVVVCLLKTDPNVMQLAPLFLSLSAASEIQRDSGIKTIDRGVCLLLTVCTKLHTTTKSMKSNSLLLLLLPFLLSRQTKEG